MDYTNRLVYHIRLAETLPVQYEYHRHFLMLTLFFCRSETGVLEHINNERKILFGIIMPFITILHKNSLKFIYFIKLIQCPYYRVLLFRSSCITSRVNYYIVANVYFLI